MDLTLANNVAELLSTARTAEAIETSALMLPMPTYDSNPSLPELTVKPKLAKDVTSAMEAAAARRFAIKPMTLKDVLNTAIKDGIDVALKDALSSAFKDIFKDVTLQNTVADKVKEANYKTLVKKPRGAIKDAPTGILPTYSTLSSDDGVKESQISLESHWWPHLRCL